MTVNLTNYNYALKEHYTDARVREMVYKNNPLHALLPKMENFGGKNMPTPVKYGNPQSRSATFATAQTQSATSGIAGISFTITRVKDYALASLDSETMMASQGDMNAFLEAATETFDGAIHTLTRSLAIAEYGDGSGSIGAVSAEPAEAASIVITLSSPESVTNFEIGMNVNIYSAATSGTLRTSNGSTSVWPIEAINRDTGVLTLTGAYNSSGTIAANDVIVAQGDYGLKIKGLAAWLPLVAPTTGDNFFGVDRSVDSTRLAGVRYDGRGVPIEEGLQQAARRLEREGGQATHCFMNYSNWSKLELSLGSKVIYCTESAQDAPNIGFRGIMIQGTKGTIKVIADANCPDDKFYLLQMDTWQLASLGRAVEVADDDGLAFLRQASSDGVEGRYRYYANLRCFAPGWNLVGQLS
jgi:hypothetical protein